MATANALPPPTTAYDQNSTIVAVLELSEKSWLVAATVPGVARRPKKCLPPRQLGDLVSTINKWKAEAEAAGKTITRIVIAYEIGRDGFWIGRDLETHGIEVHVMQPSSIPVERTRRRAKTDRIDTDMLLRTLQAWLRGEPRVCSMVPIPTVEEEAVRRPNRERERLTGARIAVENQINSIMARFGLPRFHTRRKDVVERLAELRDRHGNPLDIHTAAELRRLGQHQRYLTQQLAEVNAELAELVKAGTGANHAKIGILSDIRGIDIVTAAMLVFECYARDFANRRVLAGFVGLAGTPYNSGGMAYEQGISKAGNPRLRKCLVQLAWRWLRFQPNHPLTIWFKNRTAEAKNVRIRKIMIVAVARKILVLLWKITTTGELSDDIQWKSPHSSELAAAAS